MICPAMAPLPTKYSPMPDCIYVLGNSIASLVTALSSARAGRPVELLCSQHYVGGSFGGLTIGESRYDLGIRLFELDYEGTDRRPLSMFRPDTDGHRPFIDVIARFIKEISVEPLSCVRPEMLIRGQRVLCPLMSVDLSGLAAALPEVERMRIARQASLLPYSPPSPGEESLEQASLIRHGKELHDLLIAPVCAKQWDRWPESMAAERRKLWAALFHADTVAGVFGGQGTDFRPYRPFASFADGQAFGFVDLLWAAVQAHPLIRVRSVSAFSHIGVAGKDLEITAQSGETFRLPACDVIIGLPPEQFYQAMSIPFTQERIVSTIAWARVPEVQCQTVSACLTIPGSDTEVFRISNAGPGVFCLEFGGGAISEKSVRSALEVSGSVLPGADITLLHKISGPAQPAPTLANRDRFMQARHQLDVMGFEATLVGGLRRFGWGSLNDHIIDGLYYGVAGC